MDFLIKFDLPSIEEMGLEEGGIIHKKIDERFIHYMKLKMPVDSYSLLNSVREVDIGTIQVQSPYANYMNEGILYVDPVYGYGAIPMKDKDGNLLGFFSRKGVSKVPSGRELNYHSGPGRGALFVGRTIVENTDDIIRDVIPYLGGKK